MTQTSSLQYALNKETHCPNCHGPDVDSTGNFEGSGDDVLKDVYCADCGWTWQEVYTIAGYRNLEPPPAEDPIIGVNQYNEQIHQTQDGTRYYYSILKNRKGENETVRSAGIHWPSVTDPKAPIVKIMLARYYTEAELA